MMWAWTFAVIAAIIIAISVFMLWGRRTEPTAHGVGILTSFAFIAAIVGGLIGTLAAFLFFGSVGLFFAPCWALVFIILAWNI